ncbi:hypothetical protein [Arthrobacter sp. TMN-49]
MNTINGFPLSRQRTRILATMIAGTLAVTAMSGCSFVEKQTSDAWSVSYEVTVAGGELNSLGSVSYDEAPSRGEDSSTVEKGTVATTNLIDAPGKAQWSATALVTATKKSSVAATPGPGSTASCRILLDGTKEIATAAAPAGQPVTCASTTPAFEKES